jgi:hypothetical protein
VGRQRRKRTLTRAVACSGVGGAPDTIRTCESLDGIFVDDGPLAEQFVVRGEIAIFRPWLKWWVSVWKSRKCFVFQWGLIDTLSAAALFSIVSDRSNRQ